MVTSELIQKDTARGSVKPVVKVKEHRQNRLDPTVCRELLHRDFQKKKKRMSVGWGAGEEKGGWRVKREIGGLRGPSSLDVTLRASSS